jgi:hypothetical protein
MKTEKLNIYKLLVITSLTALVAISFFSCDQKGDQIDQVTSDYPRLLMTSEAVNDIRNNLGKVPLFDQTLEETIAEIDAILYKPIDVPVPKDMAGGYTHEQHKGYFFALQKAGALYQITGDEKYAMFCQGCVNGIHQTYSHHWQSPQYPILRPWEAILAMPE